VTTTGHIDVGNDNAGLFGDVPATTPWPGRDLTGFSYTESISSSINPAQWQSSSSTEQYGIGPGFTVEVTVNGQTVTFNSSATIYGTQALSKDQAFISLYGVVGDTQVVSVHNHVLSDSIAFVPTGGFTQSQSFSQDVSSPAFEKSALFSFSDFTTSSNTLFIGTPDSITVTVSAVPESSPYVLMFAGLALTGAIARRKSLG
jgi:hypothetical protein